MDSARSFMYRIVRLFFVSFIPVVLVLGVPFVLSILVWHFTAKGIAAYILLRVHGGLFASFLVGKLVCKWYTLRKQRWIEGANELDGAYLKNLTGLPAIFTYETMEIATGGFSKEIGKGGFGAVYEGIMKDGTPVAVKCLVNQSRQGHAEFCAEIATISSINHSNLVRLHGICIEGAHRILAYEFMANGSLDRWLFASDKSLDWKTRYSIALETARGLAYLHEESRLSILHLDIKPQNILLDENFKTKVSDFGMARSLDRGLESRVVTQVKGTAGYMAPEWFFEQGITSKSDVFSYGMVLLEIISGRRNVDNSLDSDNWYFPSIACNKVRQGEMEELIESGLELKKPEGVEEAYRLIKTALWCIQSNSARRPSMGTVVRMLEGNLEIMDPPLDGTLPFASSVGYVKPTGDTIISIAEEMDMTSNMASEGIEEGYVKPTGDTIISIAEEMDTTSNMASEGIEEVSQLGNGVP